MQLFARTSCAALFIIASVEPSVYTVDKYLGPFGVVVLIILGALAMFCLPRADSLLGKLSPRQADYCAILAILAVLTVTLLIYPKVNVHSAMQGSDRDDALIDATSALLHGHYPYNRPTYLGNPITPLPGTLFLAIPFVLAGNVGLANVFWCAALFVAVRWYVRDSRAALLALLCALVSPEVMHEIATGGDMFANGIYVGIFVLLVATIIPRSFSLIAKIFAATLLGVGLASRPTYVLLIPVLFQYLRGHLGIRAAAAWIAVSIVVLVGVTGPFYVASSSQFAPFHLTTKLSRAAPFVARADVLVPAFTMALALAFSSMRIGTTRAVLAASGVIVGFPTYLLVGANLGAERFHDALEYFAAGLSATGLYVLALGVSLRGLGASHVPGVDLGRDRAREALDHQ